ncbi:MAG: low molecular weight protein arginine phosphatase [Anaerolineales bacterium]
MPNILFVCTANICRSPVAEVIFADWLARKGVPGGWQVTSAGTWALAGQAASTYSRDVLADQGLTLGEHRSRRVDREMLQNSDVVLCMTSSQCEAIQVEFPEHAARVHLLTALTGPGYDVADPYGGPREGYVLMAAELQRLIEAAGPRIVSLAGVPAGGRPPDD